MMTKIYNTFQMIRSGHYTLVSGSGQNKATYLPKINNLWEQYL